MASEKRTVAIVGAGPAGLVTAATLLRTNRFRITIFESTSHIGGLWSPSGLIDPAMTANLCQHTVSFAGLSWASIEAASIHPKAHEVTQYLYEYYRRHIPSGMVVFDTEVIAAELQSANAHVPDAGGWKITTKTQIGNDTEIREARFDFLVVATGQFSKPRDATKIVADNLLQTTKIPIMHSTKYRSLADIRLCNEKLWEPGARILVVGGSHSGSEIASKIALELSTLATSEQTPQPELIHVTSREIFALSPLLPTGQQGSVGFEPADFRLYNRSSRPSELPVSFIYELFSAQKHDATVKMLQSLSGDQPAPEAESRETQLSAVISESYTRLAAFGMIKVIQGSLQRVLQPCDHQNLTAIVESPSGNTVTLNNVIGIVHANGFDTAASVSFLDEITRAQLGYDPSCEKLPLLLDTSYLSQNSNVSTMGIIGFTTQYWGVMEMQARALAEAWVNQNVQPPPEERIGIMNYSLALRKAIKSCDTASIPPNIFGDYVGLVEQAARELGLDRVDGIWSATEGPVCPARYVNHDDKDQKQEAMKTITRLQQLQQGKSSVTFAAKAVFYGLLGRWKIKGLEISENLHDTLSFRPRLSVHAGRDFEYLVTRKSIRKHDYEIYRLVDGSDHISIWSSLDEKPFPALACIAELVFASDNGATTGIIAREILAKTKQVVAEHRFHFVGTRIVHYEIIGATTVEEWRPVVIRE